ncbi:aminoglycoside phosphotransferase family protein [Amycolatopsis sp. NPDC058986]|uniref:aminoglycoside phosphotransferase family protein n=1 Tax=unclassified Amycolatopsis TaxID=2618356 RepID=UPI00366F14D7
MTEIIDEAARARLVDRFGPEVTEWCDALPDLVDMLVARWNLEIRDAKPGNTGRTLLCVDGDGRSVVLKLTPERQIAVDEATALLAWAGCSRVVQVLDVELDVGALLLEGLEPGTQLSERGGAVPWAEIGELIGQVHAVPPRAEFPTLAERCERIFEISERRWRGSAAERHLPHDVLRAARARAAELAATGPVVLLHGDLHPANVLDGGPGRGSVAIDPRPSLGDPAIDVVDWVLLPLAEGGGLDDGIDALRPYLDADYQRVRQWCAALAPLVALPALRRDAPSAYTDTLLRMAS